MLAVHIVLRFRVTRGFRPSRGVSTHDLRAVAVGDYERGLPVPLPAGCVCWRRFASRFLVILGLFGLYRSKPSRHVSCLRLGAIYSVAVCLVSISVAGAPPRGAALR